MLSWRDWHAQLDDEIDGEVIYVPDTFNAEPGVLLTSDLLIGNELAGGAQVCLFRGCTVLRDCIQFVRGVCYIQRGQCACRFNYGVLCQGVIYELNGPDGSETKQLLKVCSAVSGQLGTFPSPAVDTSSP